MHRLSAMQTVQNGRAHAEPLDDPRDVEHARVVPGTPEQFLSDLEGSRPALILDVASTMAGRSMGETPLFADYLARMYCLPVTYDGVRVFGRRSDNGTCPTP